MSSMRMPPVRRRLCRLAVGTAALGILTACGGSSQPAADTSTPTPPASTTSPATAAPVTMTPAATASGATAPAAPAQPTSTATATSAALWCGTVQPPQTSASLAAYLTGPGYNFVDELEPVISTIRSTDNVATAYDLGTVGLCQDVVAAEGYPPPVDPADFNTAMNDFAKASAIMHSYPPATQAGLTAMTPDFDAGYTAFTAFLKAIGRPMSG